LDRGSRIRVFLVFLEQHPFRDDVH
jgi:hypothetical protein